MARPDTLRRVGAAQAAYDDARKAVKRARRLAGALGPLLQELAAARAELAAAIAQGEAEDAGRTTWGVPENARFYKPRRR